MEAFIKPCAGPVSERSQKATTREPSLGLAPCPLALALPLNLQTSLRGYHLQPEILSMTLYRQVLSLISVQKLLLMSYHIISQSAKHVTELPCARNALLAGIVSGAGMGVIRGMAAGKKSW